MKSSTDAPRTLAVARVKAFVVSESLLVCNAHGSALSALVPPFEARLFFPSVRHLPGSLEDLSPSFLGPHDGRFQSVGVTEIRLRKNEAVVRVQLFQPTDPIGSWVCIDRKLLEGSDDLYFFAVKGLPVRLTPGGETVGTITDYLETAAHGIIIVTGENRETVYLPLEGDHVTLDLESGECIVPGYKDFLP